MWYQDAAPTTGTDNKHLEGAIRADVTAISEIELRNHLQILKKTYGITKSEKAASPRLSKKALDRSKEKATNQLALDVEYALLKTTGPVQRITGVGAVAGEMGGLRHYISTTIDGLNTAVPEYKAHIEAPLKAMWKGGVTESKMILCGADTKSKINEFLDVSRRTGTKDNKVNRNVTEIEDAGWAKNVTVEASPFLAENEILIYCPDLIHVVLLRQEKDTEVSDPKYDAEAYQCLFEMTIQIDDPLAAVWVKNLLIS